MISQDDDWLKVFPIDEAARAVGFLWKTWNELAALQLSRFHARIREPDLTFVLAERLKDTALEHARLTGRWGQESLGGAVDSDGKISRRYRTDIEYFSNRSEPRLRLIFEFKKLDGSRKSCKQYYTQGMIRFITGDYGKGEPVALMAGITIKNADHCRSSLREGLELSETVVELRMSKFADGQLICSPSKLFSPHAEFDTQHARGNNATPASEIRISHLFLDLPDNNLGISKRKHSVRKKT